MLQQCRHIFTAGRRCRQVALTSGTFCYYHKNRQPRRRSIVHTDPHTHTPTQTYDHGAIPVPAPAAAPEVQPPVDLLFPEDNDAVQINLYRIAVAQAHNRIDTRTANSMTWNQQVCLINLARKLAIEAAPAQPGTRSRSTDSGDASDSTTYSDSGSNSPTPFSQTVSRVILTPDGDEIAPPFEILEDNEAEPIHHKGCPCLLCAEKYRNQPAELHHPACQCGLCEEHSSEHRNQSTEIADQSTELGAPSLAQPKVGSDPEQGTTAGSDDSDPCSLIPAPCRIARASALLSGSTSRDPLNRPWSVAEYTFGDAIRRHEAQYAARAAAALAVGIEPPPYQPYVTGLLRPGTPEHEEDRQMQQQTSEYWAEHFRKQIAERPDIQQYLDEEAASESTETGD